MNRASAMNLKPTPAPQVILLLPSDTTIAADMRRGILRYIHAHAPWSLRVVEGYHQQRVFCQTDRSGFAAIIGRPYFQELIVSEGVGAIPQVLIDPAESLFDGLVSGSRQIVLRSDSAAAGQMAAEYFLERKYAHCAFVGSPGGLAWSVCRGRRFAEVLAAHGRPCHDFGLPPADERNDPDRLVRHLAVWLADLPKPVTVLAATDKVGARVLVACALAGLAVPQEVAVLGVDNDADLCENTNPPLSSVMLDVEQASFQAAGILDDLLREAPPPPTPVTYRPTRVVERQSTGVTQIADSFVLRAREFIANNACAGIGVPEVVAHLHASRRLAEIRFRRELGTSILEEIHRVRFERVCAMLLETDFSISRIVRDCGFDSESYVSTLFRKRHGCTMRDFRRLR